MEVTALGGQSAALAAAGSEAVGGQLGKDQFLELLVAQLNNQNPLEPMDGQEIATQLAQFTSVEQLTNMNDELALNNQISSLLSQNINSGVAAGLIGKYVTAPGDRIGLVDGEEQELNFHLEEDSATTSVEILDKNGEIVRTLDIGFQAAGPGNTTWDGMDEFEEQLDDGEYTFRLVAKDAEGNDVGNHTLIQGIVDRVTFDEHGISLWIGNTSVAMGLISTVSEAEE